jgi:hypothetical protein
VRELLRFPGRSLMLEMKDIFYQNLERLQQMERLTSVLQYRATPQAAQTRDSCGAVSDRHPALVHLLLRIVRMRAHALGRYPLAILLLGAGSGAPRGTKARPWRAHTAANQSEARRTSPALLAIGGRYACMHCAMAPISFAILPRVSIQSTTRAVSVRASVWRRFEAMA